MKNFAPFLPRAISVALATFFMGFATQATAEVWICEMRLSQSTNFVPEYVIVEANAANGSVRVLDTISYAILNRAVSPKVRRQDSKRIEMSWRSGVATELSSQDLEFSYSGTLLKAKKLFVLHARVVGWDNTPTASRGKCQVENTTMDAVLRELN